MCLCVFDLFLGGGLEAVDFMSQAVADSDPESAGLAAFGSGS